MIRCYLCGGISGDEMDAGYFEFGGVNKMDISFKLANEKLNYRVCAIMISDGKILAMHDERSPYYYLPGGRVEKFTANEGHRTHTFEWLEFNRLKDEYFYPLFLKKDIFNFPNEFTIRTEFE